VFFFLKAKIDELIRREKEREQRVQHNRAAAKPDNVMTMSTDVAPSRRAISASRLRSTHHGKFLLHLLKQPRIFLCRSTLWK